MDVIKGKIYECTRPYTPKYLYTFRESITAEVGSLWEAERVDIYRETVLLRPVDKKSSIKFLNMHFALFGLYFKEAGEKEAKHEKTIL